MNAYESFRDKAAVSRGMDVVDMEAVAQGRVWTGAQAIERGLVDALGGMSTAVAIAKQAAGIADDEPVRLAEVRLGRGGGAGGGVGAGAVAGAVASAMSALAAVVAVADTTQATARAWTAVEERVVAARVSGANAAGVQGSLMVEACARHVAQVTLRHGYVCVWRRCSRHIRRRAWTT